METGLEIQVTENSETGDIEYITMDIVDFTALCHEGMRNNKAFFENLLAIIKEMDEEKRETN